MLIQRFSVWRVNLNPTQGSEQAGSRPALVVSPDPMNEKLKTVIIAPMTTRLRGWPSRILINHDNKTDEVALDQLRTIAKSRLGSSMGDMDPAYHDQILSVLAEIFAT